MRSFEPVILKRYDVTISSTISSPSNVKRSSKDANWMQLWRNDNDDLRTCYERNLILIYLITSLTRGWKNSWILEASGLGISVTWHFLPSSIRSYHPSIRWTTLSELLRFKLWNSIYYYFKQKMSSNGDTKPRSFKYPGIKNLQLIVKHRTVYVRSSR